jgi:polyisoprenoid-binding protein YceI
MLAVAAAVLVAVPATAAEYKLSSDNTKIEFVGTKPQGKHDGGFKTVTGTVTETDGAIKIEAEIDCDSLYSDDPKLTQHLKSPDFFGVKDHPKATFKSTKVEKKDGGHVVTGELTMLGKTKEISFPAEIQAGDTFVLKAEFKINRHDFGMSYGKGKIDDEVTVKVKTEAKK